MGPKATLAWFPMQWEFFKTGQLGVPSGGICTSAQQGMTCHMVMQRASTCMQRWGILTFWAEAHFVLESHKHVRCLIRCLDPAGARPTAMELLEDPFFAKPKLPPPEVGGRRPSGLPQLEPEAPPHGGSNHHQQQDGGASSGSEEACEVKCLTSFADVAGIPPRLSDYAI